MNAMPVGVLLTALEGSTKPLSKRYLLEAAVTIRSLQAQVSDLPALRRLHSRMKREAAKLEKEAPGSLPAILQDYVRQLGQILGPATPTPLHKARPRPKR